MCWVLSKRKDYFDTIDNLMDFKILWIRFQQFGGIRLLWQYARLGVLRTGIKSFFRCLVKGESFKKIYPELLKKIEPFLLNKYYPLLSERKVFYQKQDFSHKRDKLIWFCWLQGLENSPAIVKACFKSLTRLADYRLQVIDNNNWREYVDIPEYIMKRWEKRQIPAAIFTDLLRLELLIKYGGTWIDSTVLFTGPVLKTNTLQVKDYLDADLFLFRYSKPNVSPLRISNWFISSCANNDVLMVLRDMLYSYWIDYNCTLDYYIFHLFFSMISKEYPEQIATMPYANSKNSLALLHNWDKQFDREKWGRLTEQVCFHKLSYRVNTKIIDGKNNYYNWILKL